MMSEVSERRSEFRFPVALPVEYLKVNGTAVSSYSLDLSKKGLFISSDCPLNISSKVTIGLTVPFDNESSKVFRTEGRVAWNKIRPFKTNRNGMGIQLIEPLPEGLLLRALADNMRKLMKETETKRLLEERISRLESELEQTKRLAALGRFVEKILFDLSNPILALSGQLEIIRTKMSRHKKTLEEHEETNKRAFKKVIAEFDESYAEIEKILKDYKVVSELAQTAGDDRVTLERKLRERYRC